MRTAPSSQRRISTSPMPPLPSIAKGATARSAALPRVVSSSLNSTGVSRRTSSKAPSPAINSESRESLSASLKDETDQKEQLIVLIQNKDQTISNLTVETSNLTSALNTAEIRINELYSEQSRSEAELAQRIDIAEKLRAQVRELEKENRDIQRRYNEQTATFEAERQAFYDNEQHLKSRIQSLTHAQKRPGRVRTITAPESEVESEEESQTEQLYQHQSTHQQDLSDPETEPAEMISLRLELSTLSTSYSSLQSTLVLLQTQLVDLKRVNRGLQEDNESYMILLREKTLSGQFDLMRQVGGGTSDEDEDDSNENTDVRSLQSAAKSPLDRVEEELSEDDHFQLEIEGDADKRSSDSSDSRTQSRSGRRRTTSTSNALRGETLADLPVAGPGLDLAAELGRAENKDILEGNTPEERDRSVLDVRSKRPRGNTHGWKVSSIEMGGLDSGSSPNDIDALRSEVKSLKDANKALSLYASKIIDRIISQEGFEHVLAVDYDKGPVTPGPVLAGSKLPTKNNAKARPQSVIVARSSSSPMPDTRLDSLPIPSQPNPKVQRRSLSFDWRGFSLFGGPEKKPEPTLRPLTLKPGASPLTGGRKLDNEEDEEDRKERERLNATMKLMGIQPPLKQDTSSFTFPAVPMEKYSSTGARPIANTNRRVSLFGSRSAANSDTSSVVSTPSLSGNVHAGLGIGSNLTQEALEQAEAENTLAALDAHERTLSAEIARGASSGFTEISPRVGSKRGRKSAGGSSGSIVWSAGMSGGGDDD